jgi:class 3 adenylate cyclase
MKLVGDLYMLASGLFAPEPAWHERARLALSFALDALDAMEEPNARLRTSHSLSLRAGLNSRGPLFAVLLRAAAVLPVFDILSDAINVAARLQSTDVPGKMQICEDTLDLVNTLDFAVEPRRHVFLMGKGKRPAYLVTRRRRRARRPSALSL